MTIDCSECGIQVGNYIVDELDSLRRNADHWVPHLQKEIASSGELMKISKVPGHESFIVEPSGVIVSGPCYQMSGGNKGRRQ
jgi:hypothetical protein